MSKSIPNNRSRAWCFTCNNYTDEDEEKFKNFPSEYLIYGREKGEEGTPHLQGFIYFASQRTLNGLKKKLHPTAHFEPTRDIPASIVYCKKEGDFHEQGCMPSQGRRHDLEDIKRMFDEKHDMLSVAQTNFEYFVQYHRAFERYQTLLQKPRNPEKSPPHVIWLYGPTGTGKSRWAYDKYPGNMSRYPKPPGPWFDGYLQQEIVILDDFDPTHINFRNFLHLLDRYPHQVPVKGGFVQFNSDVIIITADRHPKEMYTNPREYSQLERRICQIVHLTEPYMNYEPLSDNDDEQQ